MAGVVTVVVTAQPVGALTGFQLIQLAARRMAANVQRQINTLGRGITARLSTLRTVGTRVFAAVGAAAGAAAAQVREMLPALREGAQGFATMAAKIGAMVSVGMHALPALVDLLGIVTLVPAAIAGAASAMVVLKMATAGLGTHIAEASEDWQKWTKDNKGKMPQWTFDFVRAVVSVKKEWAALQKVVQNRFLRHLGNDLVKLNTAYLPVFARWFPRIADAMNVGIRKVMEWLRHGDRVAMLEGIMRNVTAAIGSLGRVLQPVASILLDLAVVGAPRLASLSDTLGTMAEKAAAWVTRMKDSGAIGTWLDRAITAFGELRGIVADLVGTIAAMYRGATTEGETFLAGVHAQTTALREWAESAEGQQMTRDFSDAGRVILQILVAMTQSFLGLTYIVRAFYMAFNDFLIFVLNVLNTVLQAAARAFGWIPGIGPQLHRAAAEFNGFVADVNGALNGIQTTRNISINATATLTQRTIQVVDRITARASGGLATGLIKAGERGAELIDVGPRPARVHNAGDTRQMMAGAAGAGTGPAPVVLRVASDGSTLADILIAELKGGRVVFLDSTNKRVTVQ